MTIQRAPLHTSTAFGWALILLVTGLSVACDDPAGDNPAAADAGDNDIAGQIVEDGTNGGADGAANTKAPPFWILYERRSLLPPPAEKTVDLVLTQSVNPGAIDDASAFGCGLNPFDSSKACIELTKTAFEESKSLSCAFGCIVSPDMRFIAVAKGPPDAAGLFTFLPGLIVYKPDLPNKFLFIINKLVEIPKVRDLHFAGPYLFYSTPIEKFTNGTSRYEIRRRNLEGSDPTVEDKLLVMAPETDPDADLVKPHTTYSGRFRVSEDGETLLFLTPTIRSVRVWSWHKGILTQHDYICENQWGTGCVGTGSQYADNDPAALSPDGKSIVLFTTANTYFRVRRYAVGSTVAGTFTNIIKFANGNRPQEACKGLSAWQFIRVNGTPQFSADGKTVYFLSRSQCGGSSNKVWTDLMGLKLDDIGKPMAEGLFTSYTNNPRDDSAANRVINSFALAPDKKSFVFSATPSYTSTGDPLADSSITSKKGTELYVMPVEVGAKMAQITSELSFDALGPKAYQPLTAE